MSLIVTANIDDELEITNNSQIFKPYSYSNRLLNTLKIPANSQIALQSAKINKTGEIIVSKSNSVFGHYFGRPLTDGGSNSASTTSVPFIGYAGDEDELEDGRRITTNVVGFANQIEKGISDRAYHPSLITAASANLTVTPSYSTNVWDGYDWAFTQQTAKTSKTQDFNIVDVSEEETGHFVVSNNDKTVTGNRAAGFQVRCDNFPISQNEGEVVIDWSAANSSTARSPFFCGLSRINTRKPSGVVMPNSFNPSREGGGNAGAAFRNSGGIAFCDICIMRIGEELRVFQSGVNSGGAGGGNNELVMNEIIYYGAHNANFASVYNLRTNVASGANYEKVKFKLDNEELSIFLIDNKAAEVLLVDYTTIQAAGGEKNEVTNPTTCAKWALYPHFGAKGNTKAITIDSVSHYTSYPDLETDADPTRYDWWQWSEANENQTQWARLMESRPFNDKNSSTVLAPKKVNASGGMDGYENQLITKVLGSKVEEIFLYRLTLRCNTSELFGFKGKPISPTAAGGTNLLVNISSVTTPSLSSNVSLFIRLNNFTQSSVNARMGTQSKIVAHLPRFDVSGNDTGGLYFEPSEKTYIDLNNPTDVYLNSFDVDYCYENEQLCKALVGKTITVFHIRQKPN